jgi:hypothetical protein
VSLICTDYSFDLKNSSSIKLSLSLLVFKQGY